MARGRQPRCWTDGRWVPVFWGPNARGTEREERSYRADRFIDDHLCPDAREYTRMARKGWATRRARFAR